MNTTTPPADVLVVGAGGVFGWPAIRLLLDRGGAVRGRAQPARPRPLRYEAVDEGGHRATIDAERTAGLQRCVRTSALMASPVQPIDFERTRHSTEQALASSGLCCT